ncbi:MAG: hypothetical protein Q7K65_02390 [Candidatus Buchananbacteria bacterium]|nr:hypothetical protein [Candidatus Buchananbacteria bacterium]
MTKNNHGLEKSLIESIKNRQNKADNTLIPRPLSTIRQECLDCCLDQPGEVSFCPALECPFYLFRFGRRPTDKEISQFLIDCHEPEILNEAYIDLATQVKKILNSVKENK